jgi:AraC-like DNA-binding protein
MMRRPKPREPGLFATEPQQPPKMLSMQVVRTLVDAIAKAGVSRRSFLTAASLDESTVMMPYARLPLTRVYELFELAIELTGDPAFGLHSIDQLSVDALNPVSGLLFHASNLQDALTTLLQLRELFGQEPSLQLRREGTRFILEAVGMPKNPPNVQRFAAELVVAGLFKAIRRFDGEGLIDCAAFDYAAPSYAEDYRRIFGNKLRFGAAFSGIRFDMALMAARAPHPDAEMHHSLYAFALERVRHMTVKLPFVDRVRDALIWRGPLREMSMRQVAGDLGISARTLRRYLETEGRSYGDLVNEALTEIAKNYLRDRDRTISETAHALGFGDNTSFHRAFKRWTGLTPKTYREQLAQPTEPAESQDAELRCFCITTQFIVVHGLRAGPANIDFML